MAIDISTGETGTTRVFSLSMPAAHAKALQASNEAQFAILGVAALNPDGIEVFPVSDLDEIGLAGYLRQGTDADETQIKRDAAKLRALDGWVMLVHSLAFGGNAMRLPPEFRADIDRHLRTARRAKPARRYNDQSRATLHGCPRPKSGRPRHATP